MRLKNNTPYLTREFKVQGPPVRVQPHRSPIFHDYGHSQGLRKGPPPRDGAGDGSCPTKLPTREEADASSMTLHNTNAASSSLKLKSRTYDTLSNTSMTCPYYNIAAKYQEMQIWTPGVPLLVTIKGKTQPQ